MSIRRLGVVFFSIVAIIGVFLPWYKQDGAWVYGIDDLIRGGMILGVFVLTGLAALFNFKEKVVNYLFTSTLSLIAALIAFFHLRAMINSTFLDTGFGVYIVTAGAMGVFFFSMIRTREERCMQNKEDVNDD